jgi:cellulose biosynthesis protein BcsQ
MKRPGWRMTDYKPFKIAIASGKGGTGKTLVATNLFHSLISRDIQASLVDCDAEAPNAKLFFEGKAGKIVRGNTAGTRHRRKPLHVLWQVPRILPL